MRIYNFRVGDIVGTTSGSPIAMAIKIKTWGWKYAFAQDKSSHIATVVDRGQGLLYFAEMLSKKIELTEIHTYENTAPRSHICFVGRNPIFSNSSISDKYNNLVLEAHAQKIKYGYEDIVDFIGIHVKDNPLTWICSELPKEIYKKMELSYPKEWDRRVSPKDWHCWKDLKDVTKDILP